MKKIVTLIAAMAATLSVAAGPVMVPQARVAEQTCATLPIVTTEPITQAPAGTVVSNMIRKGYSYYYNGGVYGGYNDSFVGEIVLGNDSCIYIKNACASAAMNCYLKLSRVNDTLYVAHTAQMIYVDMSYETPYTYYATRLVFTEYANGTFGWTVEEVGGEVQADVYFTYTDGVLRQRDQSVMVRGEYTYPHEIIGFTNVSGGWVGFGDGCIEIAPVTLTPTALPEGATTTTGNFSYGIRSSRRGFNATDAELIRIAEVGDEYYLTTPLSENMWVRGVIDRTAGTVTFRSQYIGVNTANGLHQWFVPTVYSDWFDMIDEEENYGYWMRDYEKVDSIVLSYRNGVLVSDSTLHQCFYISRSAESLEASGTYVNATIQPYEERQATPQDPLITYFDENNGLWGEFGFYIQPVDADNMLLNKSELYYRIYPNHSATPYVFVSAVYDEFTTNTTDVPFGLDDNNFMANQTHNAVIFYEEWKCAGVQVVLKHGGREWTSNIVWSDGNHSALEQTDKAENGVSKVVRDGVLLIIKDGVEYSVMGQKIR